MIKCVVEASIMEMGVVQTSSSTIHGILDQEPRDYSLSSCGFHQVVDEMNPTRGKAGHPAA
jgi:hypothetical protein